MKAPPFDYVRPETLPEALSLLAQQTEEARVIAGGQSLLPMLNMRLAAPTRLIDIGRLNELRGIHRDGATLRIGALTRHRELGRDPLVARHAPLLTQAVPHIGHEAIRARGTLGGSVANADPAAELPACMLALDAVMIAQSEVGERRIAAGTFFHGLYQTALTADEMLTAVEIPVIQPEQRCVFLELARRAGDFALAGVAIYARMNAGLAEAVRIAVFGVGDRPVLAHAAAAAISGEALGETTLAAARQALDDDIEPFDDPQTSAATRRQLARTLLTRALQRLQVQEPPA